MKSLGVWVQTQVDYPSGWNRSDMTLPPRLSAGGNGLTGGGKEGLTLLLSHVLDVCGRTNAAAPTCGVPGD